MRTSLSGLHKGTRIHVKGMGKRAKGTISREPAPNATFVDYRCDWNMGELRAKIENVRKLIPPRYRKGSIS